MTGKLDMNLLTPLNIVLRMVNRQCSYRKQVANQMFPRNGLKSLFDQKREKDICFCLAFVDTSGNDRCLKESIEMFDSNIAKYSLIELKNGIKQYGFDFKIIQLKRA